MARDALACRRTRGAATRLDQGPSPIMQIERAVCANASAEGTDVVAAQKQPQCSTKANLANTLNSRPRRCFPPS